MVLLYGGAGRATTNDGGLWPGQTGSYKQFTPEGNDVAGGARAGGHLGLYPIVTFQYSSTTLYQVSYQIQ